MTDVDRSSRTSTPPGTARGLLRTARPKQWAKNVLVLAAPGAAGVLTDVDVIRDTALAFVALSLAASGTYFLNDAADHESDREHPKKRHRPVAAGHVAVGSAVATGLILLLAGLGVAFATDAQLALVVALYVSLTVAYSYALKHQPILDLAAVASGFVLRAIAGGVATDLPISEWFLIVASFGSLFIVAGKRHGEHLDLEDDEARAGHRATLAMYSLPFLRYVRSTSSAVAIMAYCLWAFERGAEAPSPIWYQLSVIPFVLAILSYALRLERGDGSAPEDIILHDPVIIGLGAAWAALFAAGVYVG